MNATSLNNLWSYLKGLSLTASNQRWLAEKLIESSLTPSGEEEQESGTEGIIPYTMEELNARIDEAESEIERGEGKHFEDMMDGFKQELTWLK